MSCPRISIDFAISFTVEYHKIYLLKSPNSYRCVRRPEWVRKLSSGVENLPKTRLKVN